MSVQFDPARQRYVVRWLADGRHRTRRFADRADAIAFDRALMAPPGASAQVETKELERIAARLAQLESQLEPATRHAGVYAYETAAGTRWRCVYRDADGRLSSRRGFDSPEAAARARREQLTQASRRARPSAEMTFAALWELVVEAKRAYVTPGALEDFETHGRKRLLPHLGELALRDLDEERVRAWLAAMAVKVERGELAPKTVNNARTCLSVALNEAVRRELIIRNPCERVRQLPVERREFDYLRMHEIDPYLDACAAHYRPLAELLIGTGVRISEALALIWQDVDLDRAVIRIYRQRGRGHSATAQPKGKRFRSVQVGPRLTTTLRALQRSGHSRWLFVCPPTRRGRYAGRGADAPPSRKTAHDWHEQALQDAALRDMPLHALRHTAAAAWLATGHPLIFVQRQLGHRSITTTEEHYGHLELSFLRDAAAHTEAAIAQAAKLPKLPGRGA